MSGARVRPRMQSHAQHAQRSLAPTMNHSAGMTAIRSVFMIAASAFVLASCASAERDGADGGDRQVDELAAIPQLAHIGVCSGGRWACLARVRSDETSHIKPFANPAGLGPADLASAYKLDASKAPTVTIAIVDAFHYPNADSDLATYRSQFGLPPCTKANGCFKVVNQNGAASPLPGNSPANDDWTVEAALDLDMASAACPSCKLVLVEAQDDQGTGLFVSQNAAAALPGVVAISDSWGGPSDGSDVSEDSQFFNHPGVAIFVATGDNGNTGSTPDYPSTSAHVIGVGGTSLVKSTTAARGWTEGAWSGAGSSCSKLIAKPAFQPQTVCAKRAASDVSAVADPNTGLAVFNAGSGGWIVVGGTSAASPFVAGVYARYGLATNDASFAYQHAAQFFDVTTGKNGSCGTILCNAGAGWDGPTGIGTPNGAVLNGSGGGGGCTPSCSGKTCGDDGCGGTCGSCATGETCTPGGTCMAGGGACTHPICSTGAELTPSCDTCAAQICAADSFCCNDSWDATCVGEVASICHETCGGGACAHSICSAGTKLTSSCDPCAAQVCAADSFCCSNRWDSQCVGEVASVCHQSCN